MDSREGVIKYKKQDREKRESIQRDERNKDIKPHRKKKSQYSQQYGASSRCSLCAGTGDGVVGGICSPADLYGGRRGHSRPLDHQRYQWLLPYCRGNLSPQHSAEGKDRKWRTGGLGEKEKRLVWVRDREEERNCEGAQ
ncbi:hypothetical protein PBY51_005094 [Eleginops maclovinus]|uniref:Uncharacterized protein n=1 Tax=Eleginops maclovinus TaxID=56733 RepID=A0AAN7X3Q7_ELEMC|nr:hypothetical protein PBY51_005094 [Eleginops maclovinus]